MKISVFGLGYVGVVSAACLSNDGHSVIGVDPHETKVDLINAGQSPIIETGVAELVSKSVELSKLRATCDPQEGIINSDLSLICVGTPSQDNGNLDLLYVERVCEQIGIALRDKDTYHVVIMRSTMLPGSMCETVLPLLERFSAKKMGEDFGLCINPEFLREGTAVWDYYNPPKTIIGQFDSKAGDVVSSLYSELDAREFRVDAPTAEMVKYIDNSWHALKVSFANEIGNISKSVGVDGQDVMDIMCEDTKLNLSPYYLKPGFAFGGSCLPKDVRALTYKAKTLDLDVPVLNAIMPSNATQLQRGLDMILSTRLKRVGFLGFAFKAGTDDLRESPLVSMIEALIGKGYELSLYDNNVNLAALTGANKDYIQQRIPHIARLMVGTIDEVIASSDIIVIGNAAKEFHDILGMVGSNQVVVDLVRVGNSAEKSERYNGICW